MENQLVQPQRQPRQRRRRRQPPPFAPYPYFYPYPFHPHMAHAPPISTHPPSQVINYYHYKFCTFYINPSPSVNPPSTPLEHEQKRGRKRKEEKKLIPFDPNNPKSCLMIKTIPCGINREEFINYVKGHCFEENRKAKDEGRRETSLVDVIYLPFDFRKKVNKGYGFVNFTEPAGALTFYQKFHNKISLPNSTSNMEIACALMQGGKESILKYLNERCTSWLEEFGPISFDPPLGGLEMENKSMIKDVLSTPVQTLLEMGRDDTWLVITKLLSREIDKAVCPADGTEMDKKSKEMMLSSFMDDARGLVELKAKEEAGRVLIHMTNRFIALFSQAQSVTREEEIEEIAKDARLSSLKLLSVLAAIRLDDEVDDIEDTLVHALMDSNRDSVTNEGINTLDPLASSTWEQVPAANTLITPVQCKSLWEAFLSKTETFVSQAIQATVSKDDPSDHSDGSYEFVDSEETNNCLIECKEDLSADGKYEWIVR